MIDAIHLNVPHIPVTSAKVAGYVTGTPDIQWTAADWARFPHSGHVRIEQGFGPFDPLHCDVLDVEARAVTPALAAQGVKDRIAAGIAGTTIYASRNTLPAVEAALNALLGGTWHGHADCWLADWNLNEAEADALIGTTMHGMTCRAVQWASPSSNPRTLVPGSTMTLSQAGCDLSAAGAAWHPAPAPKPQPVMEAMLVVLPGGQARKVLSADGGRHWS